MTPAHRHLAAFLMAALLPVMGHALWSQELPAANPAPAKPEVLTRSVLLFCRYAADAGFDSSQRQLMLESLVIKLGSASDEIRLRQYPAGDQTTDAEMDKVALLSGADAWLSVTISGSMEKAKLQFRARDLQKNQDFFNTEISSALDSRFRNAFGGLWAPVIRLMQDTIHPFRQFNQLSILGPAGFPVSIKGMKDIPLDDNGAASLSVVSPASYAWSLYVPGFKPLQGTVFVERDTRLDIQPVARLPLVLSVGLEWLSYPRLDLGVYLVPDQLELEFSGVIYDLGISPSSPTETDAAVIKSFGLFNLLAGLRWQFLQHQYPVQASLGLGGQLRYLTRNEVRLDPVMPGGFYVSLGASLDLLPECSLYVDLVPRFSFSTDPAVSQSALAKAQSAGGIGNLTIDAGGMLIEPLHFSVGMRIQP